MKVFDGHCDTISRCWTLGEELAQNSGHLDLRRTGAFEGYAQFFAIFADSAETAVPMTEVFAAEHQFFTRQLLKNKEIVTHCRTGEEAERAIAEGKTAAFLSVEGAELLDCDPEQLERAYKMGVRAVNITWNHPNLLSGTNAEETHRGLSPAGRTFVKKMQSLGMLVDVSHLSDPGFWDVAELATRPFIASHSNARDVYFNSRNLTDGQFTAIIEAHGVAGLNLYGDFLGDRPNLDTVIDHLEHFLTLGGVENVALGGDWDGCSELPQGIGDIADLERLYERLLQRNYQEAVLDAVFYSNMMRVVRDVCTM